MSKKVIIAIAIGVLCLASAFVMLLIDHKSEIDDLENIDAPVNKKINKVTPEEKKQPAEEVVDSNKVIAEVIADEKV